MPFIGKDWRSPGEAWVKTEEGSWEKLKILENPSYSSSLPKDHMVNLHVTLKSTREVAGYNTISEAFYRLDFLSAISDIRRFNYVAKLLHLLINQNFTNLSGCATRVLFILMQQLTCQVSQDQQNLHVLRQLLHDIKKCIDDYYCWGRPLGSTVVWDQHLQRLQKICEQAAAIQIKSPSDVNPPDDNMRKQSEDEEENSDKENDSNSANNSNNNKSLSDLPEELIREILLRLSDYKDLVNSSCAFNLQDILNESHIWEELCKYHFTHQQISNTIPKFTDPETGRTDYEQVFQILRRKFGLKEEYADTLVLCRYCRCLFWKSFGHPCVQEQQQKSVPQSGGIHTHPSSNSSESETATTSTQTASSSSSTTTRSSPVTQSSSHPNHGQPHLKLQQQLNLQIQQQQQQRQQEQQQHHQQHQQQNQVPPVRHTVTSNQVPLHIPVPPQAFLKLFSL